MYIQRDEFVIEMKMSYDDIISRAIAALGGEGGVLECECHKRPAYYKHPVGGDEKDVSSPSMAMATKFPSYPVAVHEVLRLRTSGVRLSGARPEYRVVSYSLPAVRLNDEVHDSVEEKLYGGNHVIMTLSCGLSAVATIDELIEYRDNFPGKEQPICLSKRVPYDGIPCTKRALSNFISRDI